MINYIDATDMAQIKRGELATKVADFLKTYKRKPCLVVIKLNDDKRSELYVKNKFKECEAIGIKSSILVMNEELTTQEYAENQIRLLNEAECIDGILLQSPIYKHLDEHKLAQLIAPEKDVDCFTYENIGKMAYKKGLAKPCTAQGVIDILRHHNIKMKGRHAVVIGRSNISGKPIADMLIQNDCTVTVCHSKTRDIPRFTRQADIVVTCVGNADMLLAEDLKPGAVVINVGFDRDEYGKLSGDVDLSDLEKCSGKSFTATTITKSTGLATVMALMENTVRLAEERMNKSK